MAASVPESELDVRLDDLLAEEARLGLTVEPTETSESDNKAAILDPPTVVLAPYDPFVKWLLSSPIEEITLIHETIPFELSPLFAQPKTSPEVERLQSFRSKEEAEFMRAELEAEYEAVADLLSVATREHNGIADTVFDLEDEREVSRERIALLESRIVKHLQDRDLAIAEKYTTEKQIADLELWKAQQTPEKRSSMFMGLLKKPEKRNSVSVYTTKDIEKLQKDIADTKLETALAKTELDTHYYRLRQLEKKCVGLKLEIAQASALEDDLQASLSQLQRERRSSLDKLRQVSDFSTAVQKQTSPQGREEEEHESDNQFAQPAESDHADVATLPSKGRREDQENKAEKEEPERWSGGAGTVYFSDFKALWARAHNSSLRELPLMVEQDGVVMEEAKTRFHEAAVAVWLKVTTDGEAAVCCSALDGDDAALPSIWDQIKQSKGGDTHDASGERCDEGHLVGPKKQHERTKILDLRDTVRDLERQDNLNGRRTLDHLKSQMQDLVEAHISEPPALIESPIVWSLLPISTRPTDAQQSRSLLVKNVDIALPGRGLSPQPPHMIEVPCQSNADRAKNPVKSLKSEADQVLESILKLHTLNPIDIDEITPRLHSILDSVKPSKSVPHGSDSLFASDSTVEKAVLCNNDVTRREERAPKRVKFDGLLKQSICQTPLSVVAAGIFKSILKKNASLLVGAAPTTTSDSISTMLRRARSASRFSEECDFGTSDRIRLLVLPPEIVNHDDNRVEAANLTLQERAQHVYRSIQPPQVSVTNLSLSLPCVWRHRSSLDFVQKFKSQVWALQNEVDIEVDDGQLAHLNDIESMPRTESSSVTKIQGDDLVVSSWGNETKGSTALKIAQDIEVTESARIIIAPLPHKSVTFKIEDNISTDDLVTSFLGVDTSAAPPKEEYSSALESTHAEDLKPQSTNNSAKVTAMIEQLARPAVWYLVRLKMLKVHSSPMSDGLRSIRHEVLETIVLQLHSKLKEISSNPSKLQAEAIIDTCSAFRHAVWLHILRIIDMCHDDSHKSAVHVTWRLLESQQYQASIGPKQTTALSNLYLLMGGLSDTLSLRQNHPRSDVGYHDERSLKKARTDIAYPDDSPVRVVCDARLLERDELLEAISDLKISVVERELSPAIDFIIDERNAIVLLCQHHFEHEDDMRAVTYELASSQIQFENFWVIIDDVTSENALHFFYAALATFTVNVQTFVCKGEVETAEVIRGIVDACAETALSRHRVLPKMWFARPFMLEEESQLERFLSSTRIVSGFAAQSILHRLSVEDLTTKSLEEVSTMASLLPHSQVELLWRLLHTSHGLGAGKTFIA